MYLRVYEISFLYISDYTLHIMVENCKVIVENLMLSESVLVELINVQKWVIKLSSSSCYLTVCTETLEGKYAS